MTDSVPAALRVATGGPDTARVERFVGDPLNPDTWWGLANFSSQVVSKLDQFRSLSAGWERNVAAEMFTEPSFVRRYRDRKRFSVTMNHVYGCGHSEQRPVSGMYLALPGDPPKQIARIPNTASGRRDMRNLLRDPQVAADVAAWIRVPAPVAWDFRFGRVTAKGIVGTRQKPTAADLLYAVTALHVLRQTEVAVAGPCLACAADATAPLLDQAEAALTQVFGLKFPDLRGSFGSKASQRQKSYSRSRRLAAVGYGLIAVHGTRIMNVQTSAMFTAVLTTLGAPVEQIRQDRRLAAVALAIIAPETRIQPMLHSRDSAAGWFTPSDDAQSDIEGGAHEDVDRIGYALLAASVGEDLNEARMVYAYMLRGTEQRRVFHLDANISWEERADQFRRDALMFALTETVTTFP